MKLIMLILMFGLISCSNNFEAGKCYTYENVKLGEKSEYIRRIYALTDDDTYFLFKRSFLTNEWLASDEPIFRYNSFQEIECPKLPYKISWYSVDKIRRVCADAKEKGIQYDKVVCDNIGESK